MAREVAELDMADQGITEPEMGGVRNSSGGTPTEVVAIFGPTASGKSAVAECVARRLGTEVVSADALQVYRGIPIITNQPQTPTRLVAIRELTHEMSVGEYATLAQAEIDALIETCGRAVICGGTGLYLRAAIADLAIPPRLEPSARADVERAYDRDPAAAFAELEALDAGAAATIDVRDRRRVVRALELARAGHSLKPEHDELWSSTSRRPSLIVGLTVPAAVLDERIRHRAVAMIDAGAMTEAAAALAGPISKTAVQALGLRELASLRPEDALEHLVRRTRRYAAYQRKWMRRIPGLVEVDATRPADEVADEIVLLADQPSRVGR